MAEEQENQQQENGISFVGFVLSLAHTAAFHFGDVPDPSSGRTAEPNLIAAQQMIDILSMLEEKTRGNLSTQERQLLEQLLYELRLRFVEVRTKLSGTEQPQSGSRTPSGIIIP